MQESEVIKINRFVPRHRQCCQNCDAFLPNGSTGWCRAKSPSAAPCQMHNPRAAIDPKEPPVVMGWQGVWPPTQPNNWCREWMPKTDGNA